MPDLPQSRTDTVGRPKRGLRREPGACEPCKYFKTKCDHQMPCSACRDDTQRYSPCAYSKRAVSMQNHEAQVDPLESQPLSRSHSDGKTAHAPTQVGETDSTEEQSRSNGSFFLGLLSIPLVVDKFKYLKSAPGAAQLAISQFDGFETSDSPSKPLDLDHPPSETPGSSLVIVQSDQLKEDFDAIVDLIWKGQVAQAWLQLGVLSRRAYTDLRHARNIGSSESHRLESSQKLWNQILQLEIHLSLMLGEAALSSPHESELIEITSANLWQEEQWLGPTRQLLHRRIQELLALDPTQPTATERFVNAAGGILAHHAFIQAAYCITQEHSVEARDLQMTVHFIFLLLRCCFAEIAQHDLTLNLDALSAMTRDQIFHKRRSKLLHCRLALKSAKFISNIFRQIFDPSLQRAVIWMQCHAVWIASTFLAIGKVRSEIDWTDAAEKLQHIERLFRELAETYPDCHLLAPAAAKLHEVDAVPQVKSGNYKKRGANALDDGVSDLATKRRRRASVEPVSTPGRPATNSESEGFSSSSDMMPVTDRQRPHDQSATLSHGDDSNRSVPITPTSILSYHHTPFHLSVDQEANQLEHWTAVSHRQYSHSYQLPVEQSIPHYSESGIICGQSAMAGLSSPIQLFRPGFVPVDHVQYGRMLQSRGDVPHSSTWDARPLDMHNHRMRHWQNTRYIDNEPHDKLSHDDTKADITPSHFREPYHDMNRQRISQGPGNVEYGLRNDV